MSESPVQPAQPDPPQRSGGPLPRDRDLRAWRMREVEPEERFDLLIGPRSIGVHQRGCASYPRLIGSIAMIVPVRAPLVGGLLAMATAAGSERTVEFCARCTLVATDV